METSRQMHLCSSEHNLPALYNEGDIDVLLNQEASDYQTGYQGQVAHLVADRKRQICLEIHSCTTGNSPLCQFFSDPVNVYLRLRTLHLRLKKVQVPHSILLLCMQL